MTGTSNNNNNFNKSTTVIEENHGNKSREEQRLIEPNEVNVRKGEMEELKLSMIECPQLKEEPQY